MHALSNSVYRTTSTVILAQMAQMYTETTTRSAASVAPESQRGEGETAQAVVSRGGGVPRWVGKGVQEKGGNGSFGLFRLERGLTSQACAKKSTVRTVPSPLFAPRPFPHQGPHATPNPQRSPRGQESQAEKLGDLVILRGRSSP